MTRKKLLTIGTFDGVHLGHRALFTRLEQLCVKYQMRPKVLYFPYPPKTILSPRPEMSVLSTPPEKKELLKKLALPAEELNFQMYREYSAENFFKKVLLQKYNGGAILAGPDFAFGKNRQGNGDFLKAKCAQLNIPLEIMPFYDGEDGSKISSSLIRKTLAQGDIPTANLMLGRPYSLEGRVVAGQKLGRKIGFPTANLDINFYKLLPLGVFAVKVRLGRKFYRGICNIGFRPTINTIQSVIPLVEVHILDFKGSIYGRRMEVFFCDKIRSESKFDSLDALKRQLAQDKKTASALID
ncbi:riboflavin biosynthesis protein RibF [Candidatus Avelusimicrobium sp.]